MNGHWTPAEALAEKQDAARRAGDRRRREERRNLIEYHSLSTPMVEQLVAWATWPARIPEEHEQCRHVHKTVGQALADRGLATGPWHDYPSGWRVDLNALGQAVARKLALGEGAEVKR